MERTRSFAWGSRSAAVGLLTAALLATTIAGAQAAPDTVGAVDPNSGLWRLRDEQGFTATFYYGNPGDFPFMGDWDCDGIDTPGLYRQSDGFVYLRNSNTQGIADREFFFGNPGDIPLAGDFNGDGCDTVSIYRPSQSRVFIINALGNGSGGLGVAEYDYYFGNPGDKPFTGDVDNDGIDEIGLHRESTGLVYFRLTHTQGNADVSFIFGDPADRILAGDWTDDGTDTVGIFRPSDSNFYLRHSNTPGNADEQFSFGNGTMLPVSGTFGPIDATPTLALQLTASGFSSPTFADAPAGDSRLFVTELGGVIRVISGGSVLPLPFLDISGRVLGAGEQGLFGMAFHPNYSTNGRFYVNYIDNSGDTQVSEFTVSGNPDIADVNSERFVLSISQPASNHNGGMLAFGPDGYLYIASGDGGGQNDPNQNGQNTSTLLGTILRIDVDGATPYAVPADNPFVGGGGAAEIWHFGLRNPWRFSFDFTDGLLLIGDVGQNAWEEVDVVDASTGGLNFGWDILEASACHEPPTGCSSAGTTLPALEYPLSGGNCSVIGGYVYRGSAIPSLNGHYFYGDVCAGWIRSFVYQGGAVTSPVDWTGDLGSVGAIFSFGTDGAGELYVVSGTGSIYKIVPSS